MTFTSSIPDCYDSDRINTYTLYGAVNSDEADGYDAVDSSLMELSSDDDSILIIYYTNAME